MQVGIARVAPKFRMFRRDCTYRIHTGDDGETDKCTVSSCVRQYDAHAQNLFLESTRHSSDHTGDTQATCWCRSVAATHTILSLSEMLTTRCNTIFAICGGYNQRDQLRRDHRLQPNVRVRRWRILSNPNFKNKEGEIKDGTFGATLEGCSAYSYAPRRSPHKLIISIAQFFMHTSIILIHRAPLNVTSL